MNPDKYFYDCPIMIEQFHVLSPRGDCIITRDFRKDCQPGTAEQFFRKVKAWNGGAPPVISLNGMHYIAINKCDIHFVFTTRKSVAAAWAVDLLNKLVKSFRDFCGVLSEESLRRNFILIYELIDEVIDSGYPQTTASEHLKLSIHSDAAEVTHPSHSNLADAIWMIPQLRAVSSPSPTIPSSANQRPIGMVSSSSGGAIAGLTVGGLSLPSSIKIPGLTPDSSLLMKNEIFVDIMERLSVVVNGSAGGEVVKASIDGAIQMKSYLSGSPELRISLNEDLVIASEEAHVLVPSSSSVLDDVIFHECADLSEFASTRILSLVPPDGEFVLMNYRVANFDRLPVRVNPSIDLISSERLEVQLSVRADIPDQNYCSNMIVTLRVPSNEIRSVSADGGDFIPSENCIQWIIKKLQGGQEYVCRARINTLSQLSKTSVGPISLNFEIPMFSVSNMQVRYLRINQAGPAPHRWVRYVTQSLSYVIRF